MAEFAGYNVEVPFGPAAGVLNGTNEALLREQILDCLKSPVGAAWMGSLTWNGGAGNEPAYGLVYYHNPQTGQTVNSMGLPNIGFYKARAMYYELGKVAEEHGKPLIPSVSPGKGEDPFLALPDMVEGFVEAGAKIVEVNYSCPNKIDATGGREPVLGHDMAMMSELDQRIYDRVGESAVIIRKLPPYLNEKRLYIPQVAKIFQRYPGKVALSLSNTIGGQSIPNERGDQALKVPGNLGGLSGQATAPVGIDQLREFKRVMPDEKVDYISCLGVMTGEDVYYRVAQLGAVMAGGVTVYYENERYGKSYGRTGQEIAEQYAEALEQAA